MHTSLARMNMGRGHSVYRGAVRYFAFLTCFCVFWNINIENMFGYFVLRKLFLKTC